MTVRIFGLFLLCMFFFPGCYYSRYYVNGIANAQATSQNVVWERVEVTNAKFKIFRVNGTYLALLPKHGMQAGELQELNEALVLDADQLAKLIETCEQIAEVYANRKQSRGIQIVEYHLTANQVEQVTTTSGATYVPAYGPILTSMSSSPGSFRRVLFRLQYFQSEDRAIQPKIQYLWGQNSVMLEIEDVLALSSDLKK